MVEQFVAGDVPRRRPRSRPSSRCGPRILVVLTRDDHISWLSLRNVDTIHILSYDQLNTYDVLVADDVVFTRAASRASSRTDQG